VDAEVNRFLAVVPNGAVVRFPAAACYAHDGSFEIIDRHGLTIEGSGSTFRAVTKGTMCRATWRIVSGSDITLKDVTVRGINDTGFEGPRREDWCQHGYSFESVQGARLLTSSAFDTAGDPIAVGPDPRGGDYCLVPPNRNILIDHFHGQNSGRTLGITHADGVTFQRSYLSDIYDNAIDIETDEDCESARNIRILNNRLGRYRFALVAYTGAEKEGRGGGIEIVGNVTEAEPITCFPAIFVKPGADAIRRNNIVIRNNSLKTLSDGINISQMRHGRVEGNTVSKNYAGCGVDDRSVVRINASEHINVFGNIGISGELGGFGNDLVVDSTSAAVSELPPDSLGELPPLPLPKDEPPTLEILAPGNGSVVVGTVDIKVRASGENLRRAEFRIDDALVKTDSGPNYTYVWDSGLMSKGAHTVRVTVYNSFGMNSSASVTVMVA